MRRPFQVTRFILVSTVEVHPMKTLMRRMAGLKSTTQGVTR